MATFFASIQSGILIEEHLVIAFLILTTLSVFLRGYVRLCIKKDFGIDDWSMMFCWVSDLCSVRNTPADPLQAVLRRFRCSCFRRDHEHRRNSTHRYHHCRDSECVSLDALYEAPLTLLDYSSDRRTLRPYHDCTQDLSRGFLPQNLRDSATMAKTVYLCDGGGAMQLWSSVFRLQRSHVRHYLLIGWLRI